MDYFSNEELQAWEKLLNEDNSHGENIIQNSLGVINSTLQNEIEKLNIFVDDISNFYCNNNYSN